jgi:hypothetical protein
VATRNRKPRTENRKPRSGVPKFASLRTGSGQALIELVAAIMVIVILVAGVVQFVELASSKGDTLATVRGEAGTYALATGGSNSVTTGLSYFRTWDEGFDITRHTSDDPVVGYDDPRNLQTGIADYTVEDDPDWVRIANARNRSLYDLDQGNDPLSTMDFVLAEESRTVDLMPVFREWNLYPKDSVTVASRVWFPRLHMEGFAE